MWTRQLAIPTLEVDTSDGYRPSLDDIKSFLLKGLKSSTGDLLAKHKFRGESVRHIVHGLI